MPVPVLAMAWLVVAAGCTAGEEPSAVPSPSRQYPGDHQLAVDVSGTKRSVLLHVPPGYGAGTPLPVVIALHFYPGTGPAMRDMTGLDMAADRHGFLVAYPDGLNNGFNALICCGTADDVGFVKALAGHLVTTWHADADRVYLAGISNGGDMSFRAAVETTGVFAAIGVVSGGFIGARAAAAEYVPRRPVSVVTVIGTQDRYFDQFQAGVKAWQERLRCVPAAATPSVSGPPVQRTSARCADGSDVDVYVVTDMGHSWPGATGGQLAAPDAPLRATDILWEFFAAHPRRR
jgi:polyhydroxybutyrate depolymerase